MYFPTSLIMRIQREMKKNFVLTFSFKVYALILHGTNAVSKNSRSCRLYLRALIFVSSEDEKNARNTLSDMINDVSRPGLGYTK